MKPVVAGFTAGLPLDARSTRSLALVTCRVKPPTSTPPPNVAQLQPPSHVPFKMWRRFYLLLLGVRLYFALAPSYIHPDEHFQGPEVMAGT